MGERERFYPSEENLGKSCRFWNPTPAQVKYQGRIFGCEFPKMEMQRRISCEGIVDDVCLFLKNGRRPSSFTNDQIRELKTRMPSFDEKQYLPPGDIQR